MLMILVTLKRNTLHDFHTDTQGFMIMRQKTLLQPLQYWCACVHMMQVFSDCQIFLTSCFLTHISLRSALFCWLIYSNSWGSGELCWQKSKSPPVHSQHAVLRFYIRTYCSCSVYSKLYSTPKLLLWKRRKLFQGCNVSVHIWIW